MRISKYVSDKKFLLGLVADLIILTGVIVYQWSGVRYVLFYCFELEIIGLFFFIYLLLIREFGFFTFLFGMFCFTLFSISFLILLMTFKDMVENSNNYSQILELSSLLQPYFDIALFVTIISVQQLYFLSGLLRVKNTTLGSIFEMKSVAYRMVMMFLAFFIAALVSRFTGMNVTLSPVITFMVMKNIMEYWKFSAFEELKLHSTESS